MIARAIGGWPRAKHETRRRRTRDLLAELRSDSLSVVKDGKHGLSLPEEPADRVTWHRWLRPRGFDFLATESRSRHHPELPAAAGQLAQFGKAV